MENGSSTAGPAGSSEKMDGGALPAFGPGECVPAKETASAKGGETIRL